MRRSGLPAGAVRSPWRECCCRCPAGLATIAWLVPAGGMLIGGGGGTLPFSGRALGPVAGAANARSPAAAAGRRVLPAGGHAGRGAGVLGGHAAADRGVRHPADRRLDHARDRCGVRAGAALPHLARALQPAGRVQGGGAEGHRPAAKVEHRPLDVGVDDRRCYAGCRDRVRSAARSRGGRGALCPWQHHRERSSTCAWSCPRCGSARSA